ncbi:hypothetical protein ACFWIB_41830 [Streptomyces sp. NPDC127051]|uniref:hypothetical protein n=1 Tax=Streptomyces sp. NPDC127051 TaxID=3347119 RepID=UPI003664F813
MVMVNFADSSQDTSAEAVAGLDSIYFGAADSLASYYKEVTSGQAVFRALDPSRPVLGPVTLPMSAACDTSRIKKETIKALSAQGVDTTKADHISAVFPNGKAQCGFGGLGEVSGSFSWMPAGFSQTALVHEIGHNLGYSHHERVRCSPGSVTACQTDGTSGKTPMGSGGTTAGLTAPELLHQAWLDPRETVQATRSVHITLRPLYPAGPGIRTVRIPVTGGKDELVVEYRQPTGALDTDKTVQGVLIHRVRDGRYGSSALVHASPDDTGALAPGTVFSSTDDKLAIRVLSATKTAAELEIKRDGDPAPPRPANPAPTPQASATPDAGAEDAAALGARQPYPGSPPARSGSPAAAKPEADLADTGFHSGTRNAIVISGAALIAAGAALTYTLGRRRRT